ncbi:MAG: flagellar export chaperone FlgN [Maledivibacter sp.]|jgi:hypothetical protein|nr:flagellar export chaperone FlgN [Maledivibacter sp.]
MSQALKELEDISELLKEKLKILNDIYDLTYEQNKQIKDNDIDGFLRNVDRRQIRMDRIHNNDEKLNNLINNLKIGYNISNIEDLNNDEVQLINQLKEEIKGVANQAYGIDIENNTIFKEKLKEVKEKAVGAKKGKKLTSKYYPKQTQFQGYFIDNKK